MMDVTRDVILDLLPLYLADEVSADTRTLVENYLETDPDLADIAKRFAAMELPGSVPSPMTEEDKMEAFREAKRLVQRRTMIWGVAIAFILLTAFGMLVLVYMGLTSVGP